MANVETRVFNMTPDFCRELLGRNPENRRIDKRVVAQYARDIEAEQWQLQFDRAIAIGGGNAPCPARRITAADSTRKHLLSIR